MCACLRVAIVTSGLRNRCYVGPSAVLPSKSLLAFTRKDVSKVEGLFAIQKNVGARTAWSVATSRTDPADDERHFDLALITPCPHQSTPVTISARRRARPNDRTDGGVGCASPEACRATAHFRFPPSEEVSPRHPAPQSPSRV